MRFSLNHSLHGQFVGGPSIEMKRYVRRALESRGVPNSPIIYNKQGLFLSFSCTWRMQEAATQHHGRKRHVGQGWAGLLHAAPSRCDGTISSSSTFHLQKYTMMTVFGKQILVCDEYEERTSADICSQQKSVKKQRGTLGPLTIWATNRTRVLLLD